MGQLTAPGTALVDSGGNASMIANPAAIGKAYTDILGRNLQAGELTPSGISQAQANTPRIGTPTVQQAASAGAMPGSVNALSSGLNKAGRLGVLIKAGLEG